MEQKFCPYCGEPYADDSAFCTKCGKKRKTAEAQPQQTQQTQQPQAPQKPKQPVKVDMNTIGMYFRKYLKIALAVMVALSLIVAIMNVFGCYNVKATVSAYGQSESTPVKLSEGMGEDFFPTGYKIGLYVLGLGALAAAGLGGYSMYLMFKNQDGSKKFFSLAALIAVAVSLVGLVLMLFGGKVSEMGVDLKLHTHFINWLYLILSAVVLAGDKLFLSKNAGPLK